MWLILICLKNAIPNPLTGILFVGENLYCHIMRLEVFWFINFLNKHAFRIRFSLCCMGSKMCQRCIVSCLHGSLVVGESTFIFGWIWQIKLFKRYIKSVFHQFDYLASNFSDFQNCTYLAWTALLVYCFVLKTCTLKLRHFNIWLLCFCLVMLQLGLLNILF